MLIGDGTGLRASGGVRAYADRYRRALFSFMAAHMVVVNARAHAPADGTDG